jgi:hypothetical protein
MSPEDLDRWREQDVVKRRAALRERYAYLTSKIKEAEALGVDVGIVKQLRHLLALVIRDANLLDREETIRALKPKATVGEKFTAGRKPGSVGKLRKWVRKFVAKYPTATPALAWAALAKRPPKGITIVEGVRPHVWVDGDGETGLARFKNIVSEERRALK